MSNKVSGVKYKNWILWAVIFSLFPVLLNIGWDLIYYDDIFWKGIRFIDFLICGFCLVGGAICDRVNSEHQPTSDAYLGTIFICGSALVFYMLAKYTAGNTVNNGGLYARDFVLQVFIFVFYVLSLVFSASLLRKTLVHQNVSNKKGKHG